MIRTSSDTCEAYFEVESEVPRSGQSSGIARAYIPVKAQEGDFQRVPYVMTKHTFCGRIV